MVSGGMDSSIRYPVVRESLSFLLVLTKLGLWRYRFGDGGLAARDWLDFGTIYAPPPETGKLSVSTLRAVVTLRGAGL